jgi:uncharacterized protein YrrD
VADPVSWIVIERGWAVVGAGGEELGTVDEVLGDSSADIFHGLTVSPGVFRSSRYVPSERVDAIFVELVRLDVTPNEFEELDEHEGTPVSAEIRSDTTHLPDTDRP